MGARRPKPTALKERTSARPMLGLSRLFSAANALVPFGSSEADSRPAAESREEESLGRAVPATRASQARSSAPAPEGDDRTLKLDDPRLKEQTPAAPHEITNVSLELQLERTRATNVRNLFNINAGRELAPLPQVAPTSGRTNRGAAPDSAVRDPARAETAKAPDKSKKKKRKKSFSSDKADATRANSAGVDLSPRTSVTKLKRSEIQRRESLQKYLALLFIIPAIGLFSYAYFSDSAPGAAKSQGRKSLLSWDQIINREAYYRSTTGERLNRERIDVQIDNFKTAPDLPETAHKVKQPDMMTGLPLAGQPNNFERTKPDLPADPTYSEARAAYSLQEDQNRVEFEREAQKQWVQEFKDNARKGGYEVQIDRFGNVKARKLSPEETGPFQSAPEANPAFDE